MKYSLCLLGILAYATLVIDATTTTTTTAPSITTSSDSGPTTTTSPTLPSSTSDRKCSARPATSKRWYSVEDSDETINRAQPNKLFAWPQKCSNPPVQPIRYCYKDQRSADNLDDLVLHAIARWAPAMQSHVSALRIDLDQGTGNDKHIYCDDPRVSADALVITDATRDDDTEYNWEECDTESTIGYDYNSQERGRHTLNTCHLKPDNVAGTTPYAIRALMHEFAGHVIGLRHEHQRPDRGDYLWFKCSNVEGYQDAVKAADIDEFCLFDDEEDLSFKIKAICNEQVFAKQYFPQVLVFLRDDTNNFVSSKKFDMESIMMYNSDSNSIAANKFVIWQKTGPPVWMGGSPDPAQVSISAGDIARVAQLYPSGTEEGIQAANLQTWGKQAMRVRVRDAFETTIYGHNVTGGF